MVHITKILCGANCERTEMHILMAQIITIVLQSARNIISPSVPAAPHPFDAIITTSRVCETSSSGDISDGCCADWIGISENPVCGNDKRKAHIIYGLGQGVRLNNTMRTHTPCIIIL